MESKSKGILFPKGTWSTCLAGIDYGKQGLFVKGKDYYHPENNCIKDENGTELFIPQSMINHFNNIGEKTGVPDIKSGMTLDDHLERIDAIKKHLEKQNTKQPPSELVEKFDDLDNTHFFHRSEECAQIAVDYAEEEKKSILYPDEWDLVIRTLIDRASSMDFDNYDSDEFEDPKAHASWLFTCADKFKQLLKKHEDGNI